jgi:8-oxo-dGTP diphosphatase
MATSIRYVAGFMFDVLEAGVSNRVALIRKKRPEWQARKLNAVGGHVEAGEITVDAMVREFREETGYETKTSDWKPFCTLVGDGFCVYFFVATGPLKQLQSPTDEPIRIHNWREVSLLNHVPNLQWLLPMAHLAMQGKQSECVVVEIGPKEPKEFI